MTAATNPYARAARLAKAQKLADALFAYGITADQAAAVSVEDSQFWPAAAEAAGVRMPSFKTAALVVEMLRLRERPAVDPFAPFEETGCGWRK